MQQVSQFKWVPLPDAAEKVYAAMQPAIRYTRDEVIDLPPVVYAEREAELSATQEKLLKDLTKDLQVRLKGGERISTANEAARRIKFLQIACGVVYSDSGDPVEIDCAPRLNALLETVQTSPSKTIVFVPFTGALNMVAKFLRGEKYTVEVVSGQTPAAQRDEIFGRFQSTPDPQILVADAGCMSHGLTLTEAALIVWYGPEESNDTYIQACGRITRQGQKHIGTFVHLYSTSFEREVFKRVKEKGKLQGVLLDMVASEEAL
jgi:SNF2 family DNA or RNA helicase